MPISPARQNLIYRFERKFVKGSQEECWIWLAYKFPSGYGFFEGPERYAHRMAYVLYKGSINGLHVLHKCDNPACVNPDHLC